MLQTSGASVCSPSVTAFIERMYELVLQRRVDAASLAHWEAACRDGRVGTRLVRSLILSDEFAQMELSDSEFIQLLYAALLLRQPMRREFLNWRRLLLFGKSRADILDKFLTSPEFAAACNAFRVRA